MPQPATKYLHRKCRREACARWTAFRSTDRKTDACSFCGAPYGRLEVGLDVQSQSASEPVEKRREAPSIPAANLPDLKPGDFE